MTQLMGLKQSVGRETEADAQSYNPLQPVSDALGQIFTTKKEETRIQKTRRIMGGLVDQLSDEDLEVYITEFQYLIDEWLDTFEQEVFDGLTLKQLLGQG